MRNPSVLFALLTLSACSREAAQTVDHPSTAEVIADETELLRLTLAPEAIKRLGIEVQPITDASLSAVQQAAGELMVPPRVAGGIPTGSRADLQLIGSQQAAADSEVAKATAQERLARTAFERAKELVDAEAGSVRARDEAAAALATAEAALATAMKQRELLGPAIAEMNRQPLLWVRVSVFAGDVGDIQRSASARVRALGSRSTLREARPVQAAPSSNAASGTLDLFYALPNTDQSFQVGQRVAVDLALKATRKGPSIPSSAIVRDIYGGEWVYEQTAPNTFVRRRVEVVAESGGLAVLARGPSETAQIVTVGAAELFGTEFGAAH